MVPQTASTPRQSNIELLRILAILGVVILHYNSVGGGFANVPAGGASMCLLYGLEGLFICCVDVFLLITGYFSCTQQRRRPSKALGLLLQVIVFQLVGVGIDLLRGARYTPRDLLLSLIPGNYFVSLYIALFFLSPYLNILLTNLTRKGLKRLVLTCLILFSLVPTVTDILDALLPEDLSGASFISIHGSISGYSIVNFALMYLIGSALRLLDIRVKKRYCALVLVLTVTALSFWGYFDTVTGMARAYCNPLVILAAVAVFLLAGNLRFHSKIVNFLSPATFTCFLLHSALLDFYNIPVAVRRPAVLVLAHVLFTAISIFLISCIAYRIYALVSKPIMAAADKLLPDPDNTAQQEETS